MITAVLVFVALIIAVLFARGILRINVTNTAAAPSAKRPVPRRPARQLENIYALEIRGESHYQDSLIAIFGPYSADGINEYCGAELVREPRNQFDKYAVRCEIAGLLVGYVAKDDAETMSKHLKKSGNDRMAVNATISGGWRRDAKDIGMYGVEADVDDAIFAD